MEHMLRQSNLPAALPYSIEDQHEGWKAIKPGSFVILSIDYELSMKKLFDPDVDDAMRSMPNKKYLALVAGKAVDVIGPIPVYKIDIVLIGRDIPVNGQRGLTGGECVPISPNNEHREGRSPVTPEAPVPFPYSDCYIHTTTALRCRLAQTHISGPEIPIFTLPKNVITHLKIVQTIDQARAGDRVTIAKIRGDVRDDLPSIDWEEELQDIRAHIARWPSDAKEKLTGGDAVYLRLFSDPTYAPQKPGESRHIFICLNVWTDITQDVTFTNPEEFPDDIDKMIELKNQSNREWLDHYKTKFFWRPDPEEHSDRVDHWVQEVDKVAEPPVDSHLLHQDASTQTNSVAVLIYRDVSTQTDSIAVNTDSAKRALHVQKRNRILGAEDNQTRKNKSGSDAQALEALGRKSPGPIGARLPGRAARAKSRIRTKAILQSQHVDHQANSMHWRKSSDRARVGGEKKGQTGDRTVLEGRVATRYPVRRKRL